MMLLKIKRQNLVKLLNIYKLMLNADCDKVESITDLLYIRENKFEILSLESKESKSFLGKKRKD